MDDKRGAFYNCGNCLLTGETCRRKSKLEVGACGICPEPSSFQQYILGITQEQRYAPTART